MKPTHFHTHLGFHAVSLYEKDGYTWTSDGKKATSVDLQPLGSLVGRRVARGNCEGVVRQFLSGSPKTLDGTYLANSERYMGGKLLNCHVGVFWDKVPLSSGLPPYWNTFSSLTFL